MNDSQKRHLLQQVADIPTMERGKLSTYSFKDRPGANGPYHKLQQWHEGKNHTRYVSADELPQVQAALAGYEQYQQLTTQYAEAVIEETRKGIADSKKSLSADLPLATRGNPTTDQHLSIPSTAWKGCGSIGDFGAHGGFQIGQRIGWLVAPAGGRPH